MEKEIKNYSIREKLIFLVLETATLEVLLDNGIDKEKILPGRTLFSLGLDKLDLTNIIYKLETRFENQDQYINIFGWENEDMDNIVQSLKKAGFHNFIRPSMITKEEKERFVLYSKEKKLAAQVAAQVV